MSAEEGRGDTLWSEEDILCQIKKEDDKLSAVTDCSVDDLKGIKFLINHFRREFYSKTICWQYGWSKQTQHQCHHVSGQIELRP